MIMIQPTLTLFFPSLEDLGRFVWNKQKRNSAVKCCLHAKYKRKMISFFFFFGWARSSVALLLCPMLMWVYYISIDFLPCIPAIDTWIYHINCWSVLSSGFMYWSMQHQEEDKETVQTPFWFSEEECWLTTLLCLSLSLWKIQFILCSNSFSLLLLHCKSTCWAWCEVVSLFLWTHSTRNVSGFIQFWTMDQKHIIFFDSS